MVIEQQFVSFLLERIEAKLQGICIMTEDKMVQSSVDETKIYVDQLNQALSTILHCETPQHEEHPTSTPSSNRGSGGRRTNRGESA